MNTPRLLFVFIAASAVVLGGLLIDQEAHAITRAEILEGYTTELKQAYNDPSLNPAATALCQLIARRLHPILPDTSQLDYDLDEKQNEYFEKIAIQLDLDKQTRGLVAWRIFRDACKAEVGNYEEPSRWNKWRDDRWSAWETEQETAKRVAREQESLDSYCRQTDCTCPWYNCTNGYGVLPSVDHDRKRVRK